jgi:hypothetical protein
MLIEPPNLQAPPFTEIQPPIADERSHADDGSAVHGRL